MLQFNKKYLRITLLLLVTEILIALFVHDGFIRPYLGDVLVVMLIYCFVKSFFNIAVLPCVLIVLLFAYTIEWLQYVKLIQLLHLEKSTLAKTVLGTSFAWQDLVAYTIGTLFILLVEKRLSQNNLT